LETNNLSLHISEPLRTKTTILDAHNVNMPSTALAWDATKMAETPAPFLTGSIGVSRVVPFGWRSG